MKPNNKSRLSYGQIKEKIAHYTTLAQKALGALKTAGLCFAVSAVCVAVVGIIAPVLGAVAALGVVAGVSGVATLASLVTHGVANGAAQGYVEQLTNYEPEEAGLSRTEITIDAASELAKLHNTQNFTENTHYSKAKSSELSNQDENEIGLY